MTRRTFWIVFVIVIASIVLMLAMTASSVADGNAARHASAVEQMLDS